MLQQSPNLTATACQPELQEKSSVPIIPFQRLAVFPKAKKERLKDRCRFCHLLRVPKSEADVHGEVDINSNPRDGFICLSFLSSTFINVTNEKCN